MSLSSDQAMKLVKEPPNQSEVTKGRKYQSRLRLLTLPLGGDDVSHETAWNELLGALKEKLTIEKYNAICKYFTFPMSIVNISNDITTDLYKVFDGRNAVFSIDYPNDRIKETGNRTLAELDVLGWIENTGKLVLKCAPNLIVVIDKNEQGDPILIPVPNEKLVGYKLTKTGAFDVVIFIHSKGVDESGNTWTRYAIYDDAHYKVIYEVGGVFTQELENPHDLGKCPARFFYNNPLVNKHEFDRAIPLSNVRGVMGQWQMFDIFDYYQDHYASFQVVQYADNGCDIDGCNGGVIYVDPITDEDNLVIKSGYNTECPTCAKKGLIGPGSSIGVVVSADPTEQDARNIFAFVAPDITALEYTGKKQKAREDFMKINTVGYSDAITSEAINEQQVKALVESRKKPLFDIKVHLEDLYKWIVESVIKLTYNVDVVANANYGTEFFILAPEEIQDLIIKSKQAGSQATYIEQLNKLLISTQYKNDPSLVQRMLISADVQPNAFETQIEARELHKEGMITIEDYYIHSNFTDLISRFERENGSIVMFGSDITYDKKIQRIQKELLIYTNEKLQKDEQQKDPATEPIAVSDS